MQRRQGRPYDRKRHFLTLQRVPDTILYLDASFLHRFGRVQRGVCPASLGFGGEQSFFCKSTEPLGMCHIVRNKVKLWKEVKGQVALPRNIDEITGLPAGVRRFDQQ